MKHHSRNLNDSLSKAATKTLLQRDTTVTTALEALDEKLRTNTPGALLRVHFGSHGFTRLISLESTSPRSTYI